MPTYDYLCRRCGPFEARRPMSESQAATACRDCGSPSSRLPSAPLLNLMSSNNRYAETRNEKSAHEPDVVHTMGPRVHEHSHGHSHEHPHGHAHGHAGKKAPSNTIGQARPMQATHDPTRPWMIGH